MQLSKGKEKINVLTYKWVEIKEVIYESDYWSDYIEMGIINIWILFLPVFLLLLLLLLLSLSSFFFSIHASASDPFIKQVTDPSPPPLSGFAIDGYSSSPSPSYLESLFHRFMSHFGKSYSSAEEQSHRFGIFKKNVAKAVKMQKLDPSATHGITIFSDLTEEEFSRHLGLKVPSFLQSGNGNDAPPLPINDLPTDFDWRELGAVTEVKNQVWFFSSVFPLILIFGPGISFISRQVILPYSPKLP